MKLDRDQFTRVTQAPPARWRYIAIFSIDRTWAHASAFHGPVGAHVLDSDSDRAADSMGAATNRSISATTSDNVGRFFSP